VLVPFSHAVDDHQTRNAEALVAIGAAEIIQEKHLDASRLAQRLDALLHDRAVLLAMAEPRARWPSPMQRTRSPARA